MNTDIRLSVEFFDHPKTVKLQRRLGLEAVICLQRLWLWAAQNRPEGRLSNMDAEDVEIAAKWAGETGALCSTLVALGWLDEAGGQYSLHDWEEHNPWQSEAKARSEQASKAAQARWGSNKRCSSNAAAMQQHANSNAPLLSSPNPGNKENTNTPPKAPPTPEVLPSEQGSFEGEGLNASRPSRQNGTNPRAMGNNPRGNSSNPRATGTNPRAQAELVGDGFDPDCSLEFQELRELYDREGKAEAPMTGHVEFLALCKQRLWPGIPRIAQAFEDLQQDWQWAKDGGRYRPGLAKFLRERWWEKQPDTRASPQTEKERDGIRAAQAAYRLFGNKGGQANAYSASDTRPTGNTSQGLPA